MKKGCASKTAEAGNQHPVSITVLYVWIADYREPSSVRGARRQRWRGYPAVAWMREITGAADVTHNSGRTLRRRVGRASSKWLRGF